jgi:hypothetical protein
MRARLAILLAGTVALGGCAYGYGGYGGYGSGLSVGIGYGSGYDGYYGGGYYGGGYPYGGYGYGYGDPYFGWYDDYYYPGTGYYVYDSYRRPHRWNRDQERYWTQKRERMQSAQRTSRQRTTVRENWSGFDRRRDRDRQYRDSKPDSTRPQ